MPEKKTVQKAKQKLREGKKPSTAAGEFVREEIEHIREGKHGARSTEQAIAIGLSKARRAGIPLEPPEKGETSEETRESAERDYKKGQSKRKRPVSKKRSAASKRRLKKYGKSAASKSALSKHAKKVARRKRTRTATRKRATGRKSG